MFDGTPRDLTDSWSSRNEHWIGEISRGAGRRRLRERRKDPLILCGNGVSLRVDGGTLLVRNGLTHYPQRREEFRFFKGDPAIPPRIIMIDGSGCVSFDVLDWLAEQRVPLVRISWQGEVVSVIAGSGFAADREKVRWQAETRADPARRMEFAIGIIAEKIANSIETLEAVIPQSRGRDVAVTRLRDYGEGLRTRPPSSIGTLLGVEGNASVSYFKAWEGLALKWKAAARPPIPESWRMIGPRSALRAGKPSNERAVHPLNAMLNYAYAILQSQVQIEAVAQGYDPTLGIMHNPGRRAEPALVFDLMEPRRPRADAAVLAFALGETFSPADFVIRSDGTVRLMPQLARRGCQVVTNSLAIPREPGQTHTSHFSMTSVPSMGMILSRAT
jgi:CRISPR-associated endonuclease Cas1